MVQGGPCCKSCGAERERLVSLLPESGDLEEWLEGLLACNHAEPQEEEHRVWSALLPSLPLIYSTIVLVVCPSMFSTSGGLENREQFEKHMDFISSQEDVGVEGAAAVVGLLLGGVMDEVLGNRSMLSLKHGDYDWLCSGLSQLCCKPFPEGCNPVEISILLVELLQLLGLLKCASLPSAQALLRMVTVATHHQQGVQMWEEVREVCEREKEKAVQEARLWGEKVKALDGKVQEATRANNAKDEEMKASKAYKAGERKSTTADWSKYQELKKEEMALRTIVFGLEVEFQNLRGDKEGLGAAARNWETRCDEAEGLMLDGRHDVELHQGEAEQVRLAVRGQWAAANPDAHKIPPGAPKDMWKQRWVVEEAEAGRGGVPSDQGASTGGEGEERGEVEEDGVPSDSGASALGEGTGEGGEEMDDEERLKKKEEAESKRQEKAAEKKRKAEEAAAEKKRKAQEKADQEKEKEAQDRAAQGHLDPWSTQEAEAYLKELKKKPLAEALKAGFRRDGWRSKEVSAKNESLGKMIQTFEAYGLQHLHRQRVERIFECEKGLHLAIWAITRVHECDRVPMNQRIPDWAGNVVSWAGGLLLSILPMMGMIA